MFLYNTTNAHIALSITATALTEARLVAAPFVVEAGSGVVVGSALEPGLASVLGELAIGAAEGFSF